MVLFSIRFQCLKLLSIKNMKALTIIRGKIMIKFTMRRILFSILSLFIIVTATFFLMKAAPGDPFSVENKKVPEEIMKSINDFYGLSDPIHIQYFNYLKKVITWDLGPSFTYKGMTVNEIINSGFPVSLTLGFFALLIGVSLGLLLGIISALNHNNYKDYTAMIIAVLGISIPSFILAAVFQYIFGVKLGILPVAKWGTISQAILPTITLAVGPLAVITRVTRSSMLETLSQNYIKTAKSKGIPKKRIIYKHALRNSMLTVTTYLGPMIIGIITGTFVIENIFGIPGLGSHFVVSVLNRDYTVIMGTTVFYSALLLITILIVDLMYGLIDPRIKYSDSKDV